MTRPTNTNSWSKWEKLVIYRLDDLTDKVVRIDKSVTGMKIKMAGLSAGMGLLAGFLYHSLKG